MTLRIYYDQAYLSLKLDLSDIAPDQANLLEIPNYLSELTINQKLYQSLSYQRLNPKYELEIITKNQTIQVLADSYNLIKNGIQFSIGLEQFTIYQVQSIRTKLPSTQSILLEGLTTDLVTVHGKISNINWVPSYHLNYLYDNRVELDLYGIIQDNFNQDLGYRLDKIELIADNYQFKETWDNPRTAQNLSISDSPSLIPAEPQLKYSYRPEELELPSKILLESKILPSESLMEVLFIGDQSGHLRRGFYCQSNKLIPAGNFIMNNESGVNLGEYPIISTGDLYLFKGYRSKSVSCEIEFLDRTESVAPKSGGFKTESKEQRVIERNYRLNNQSLDPVTLMIEVPYYGQIISSQPNYFKVIDRTVYYLFDLEPTLQGEIKLVTIRLVINPK